MSRPPEINPKLKADIKGKLDLTDKQFYAKVGKVRRNYHYPLMKPGVAACLLAIEEARINPQLRKYGINQEVLEEVNRLQRETAIVIPTESIKSGEITKPVRKKTPPSRRIGEILPLTFAETLQADGMSDVYYKFYQIENSIRRLIIKVFEKKPASKWWDDQKIIHKNIQTTAEDNRQSEGKSGIPWHGRRGENVHPIYYINFRQLHDIITKNWKSKFAEIIEDRPFFDLMFRDLNLTRNILMHCNPLSEDDVKHLDFYFRSWKKTLEKNKSKIPE